MGPGDRIRFLRLVSKITREQFCKNGINFNTLVSIETDRLKLSDKQINKITQAFHAAGIYVEKVWIKEGKGPAPSRMICNEHSDYNGHSFLEAWASGFSYNKQAVHTQVPSAHMEPFYSEGDFVGGIWHNSVEKLLGKKCIVELNKKHYIGNLLQYKDIFTLTPADVRYNQFHVVFKLQMVRIAEILWHIRKHSQQTPEVCILNNNNPLNERHGKTSENPLFHS